MAERDARVRLNLTAAGFLTQMRELQKQSKEFGDAIEGIGDDADKASRKTSGFFGAVKTAAGGARSAVGELGGQLKNVLTMAATLGGSLSVGAAIHQAKELSESYRNIAFAVRVATGENVTAAQVQADIATVADRWKQSTQGVTAAYEDLFKTSGDVDFSKKGLATAAKTSTATGASLKATTAIVNELGEKFGVAGDRMDDAMASLVSTIPGGKAGLEELGDKLGLLGASARGVGLEGEAGLKKVLGILNVAGASGGNFKKELMSTVALLEQLGDVDQAKNIEKKLGIKITDKSGATKGDALERIITATGGKREDLSKVFSGPVLRLVGELGKAFEQGAAGEGDENKKAAAGIDALRAAMAKTGKGAIDAAGLQEQANERNKDAQRNLQQAMNDFTKAFERPEIVNAIDQVAAAAPKLARTLGNLIEFASKHPLLSAGAVVGGVAAKGAAGAVLTKVSEAAMEKLGKAGEGMAKSLSEAAAKHPGWATAGKSLGVAAAALIAFEIGKALIDKSLDKDEQGIAGVDDAAGTAESMLKHGTGNPEQRAAAAKALEEQIATLEASKPGFASSLGSMFAGEGDSIGERQGKSLGRAKAMLAALKAEAPPSLPEAMAAAAPSSGPSKDAERIAREVAGGGASNEPRKMALTNEQALAAAIARQLGATPLRVTIAGGGTGTNGLPGAPGNGSGSTPL